MSHDKFFSLGELSKDRWPCMYKEQERECMARGVSRIRSVVELPKPAALLYPLIGMLVLASGLMPSRPVFSFADHWEKSQVGELTSSIGRA